MFWQNEEFSSISKHDMCAALFLTRPQVLTTLSSVLDGVVCVVDAVFGEKVCIQTKSSYASHCPHRSANGRRPLNRRRWREPTVRNLHSQRPVALPLKVTTHQSNRLRRCYPAEQSRLSFGTRDPFSRGPHPHSQSCGASPSHHSGFDRPEVNPRYRRIPHRISPIGFLPPLIACSRTRT
jgi:hypothetical protein